MALWMENMMDGEARTDNRVLGFVLKRETCGEQWLYLGSSPDEVGKSLAGELQGDEGLSIDEMDKFTIEPRLFTPKELAEMPEFEGW